MKLLTSVALTLLASTLTYAQTTMCFKENHNSMATIESTKLDGGECKGEFTLNDMKNKGFKVDDIKITNLQNGKYNFVYILKDSASAQNFNSNLSERELENKIIKRLEAKKAKEKKEKEIQRNLQLITEGKEIYINKCQSCHGTKGEKTPYNVGTPLKELSENDIVNAINQYSNDSNYGYGYNLIMSPIANATTKEKVIKVKAYLDSINQKQGK